MTNETLVNEVQEIIQFYDQRGDGKVSVTQIGNCIRALGLSPTEKQIEQLTQQWTDSGKFWKFFKKLLEVRISVEELTPIYSSLKKDTNFNIYNSLIECMRNYDREGNGNISIQDLKCLLTNYGKNKFLKKNFRRAIKRGRKRNFNP